MVHRNFHLKIRKDNLSPTSWPRKLNVPFFCCCLFSTPNSLALFLYFTHPPPSLHARDDVSKICVSALERPRSTRTCTSSFAIPILRVLQHWFFFTFSLLCYPFYHFVLLQGTVDGGRSRARSIAPALVLGACMIAVLYGNASHYFDNS